MNIRRFNNLSPFSFKSILALTAGLSLLIQIILVSYNHFTGFHIVKSTYELFLRIGVSTIISTVIGLLIVSIDLLCIKTLNKKLPWSSHTSKRFLIQIVFVIVTGVSFSYITTTISNDYIHKYEETLSNVYIINAILFSVSNLLFMIILEGWAIYYETKKTRVVTGSLKYELSQLKFDVLKNQINPHFMFNSLNVLAGLIRKDTVKAQQFIEDFAKIYRYVAETIEEPLVTLKMELSFVESYIYLQKIRYGETLKYKAEIPDDLLEYQLPPLSLQVVLENAIKHNVIDSSENLCIEIVSKESFLIIKNRISPKKSYDLSAGAGLKNLTKRYAFVSNRLPELKKSDGYFIVKIPLITD